MQGGGLAVVAAEADELHALVAASQVAQSLDTAIGRAVIDEDDLPGLADARQNSRELLIQERDIVELVANGNDDGNHHDGSAHLSWLVVGTAHTTIESARSLRDWMRGANGNPGADASRR